MNLHSKVKKHVVSMKLTTFKQIRHTIIIGFAVLGLLVMITGVIGIYYVNNIVKVLNDVTDYSTPLAKSSNELIENLIESNGIAKEIQVLRDSTAVQELIVHFDEYNMQFGKSWNEINNLIIQENLRNKLNTALTRQQQFNKIAHEMFSYHMKSLESEYGVSQILKDIDYNRSMLLVKLNSLINEIELNKGKMTPETFGDNILLLNAIRNIQSQIIQLQKIFRDYLTEDNPDQFYKIDNEYQNLLTRGEQGAELIDNQLKSLQVRDRSFRRYWNLWRDLVIADEGLFSKYREQIQAEDNAKELVNRFDNEIETAIVALENISLYAENISNRADEQQIVVRAPFTLYLTIVISLLIICFLGIIVSQYVTSSAKHIEHTMKKLEQSKDQLSKLTGYLLEIREEERSIISREIHDELGQALTAIQIDATLINLELPENADYLHKKVKSMIELIQTTITNVQKISGKLRPAMLDQLGLESAIHWYIGEFQNRTGISCQVDFNYHDITEDKKIPITLYRILQESLTNIARHAKASEIIISLKDVKDHIELTVRDNGRGITDEQIKDSQSFGLRGMEERIRQLHGDFSIKGSSGQGTIVAVTIPLGGETRK